MKIITDSRCMQYSCPGHPERPSRISSTLELLKSQKTLPIHWEQPGEAEDSALLRAHPKSYLERLAQPLDFDMDTPSYPDVEAHARRSVGGALLALQTARQGGQAFSLSRPPGHHAVRDRAMGFCYLGNVAIAALAARAAGVERVAVFDFDVHHGNGTEEILLGKEGLAFYSIHQVPAYPGTGTESRGNCHNYPVPPGLSREGYREVAEKALADLREFKPEVIGVSAGFDAYAGDPLCHQRLSFEDYHWFGQVWRDWGVPVFSVLEGGYSDDLSKLIFAYLLGLEGRSFGELSEAEDGLAATAASPTEDDPDLEPYWGPSF